MSNSIVYTFTQAVAAQTWTINHGFGAKQVSDVYVTQNGQIQKILPLSVKHVSDTTVLIEFSEPRAGGARLIGASLEQWVAPAPPSSTAYRFFRVRVNSYVGQAVRFQSVQLMVGAVSHPLAQYLPMTTNSLPAPLVASASSVYSSFEPYLAFVDQGGGLDTHRWIHAFGWATPQWITIDLGIGHEIVPTAIRLTPDSAGATDYPTSFTVLGSNTGVFGAEAVVLFESGTLTGAAWAANTPSSFTLLSPPWVPEVAGPSSVWTQAGGPYWSLNGNVATSSTPANLPSIRSAIHGHFLAEGEYTDVLLGSGYPGDVGLLGVTDGFGPMLYDDTGLKFLAWYWSGLILKDGANLGAIAPSNLTGPQRYRIARGPNDTMYFSKVSTDGLTLQGTVYSNTMSAGFSSANLHVVVFGQYTPGYGYPAPSATAYAVQTGTGGLYTLDPHSFLDTFTGAAQELSLHAPDIGNAWAWFNTLESSASTTGSGSVVSNNENGGQPSDESDYRSVLTHTGTDFELTCFVDEDFTSSDKNLTLGVFKGSSFEIFQAYFSAGMNTGGESGTTTGRAAAVFINNANVYSYGENAIGFATGVEYKLVISGTSVRFFIDGSLISFGTIPAFTEGPTHIALGVGHNVSISSVGLTFGNPVVPVTPISWWDFEQNNGTNTFLNSESSRPSFVISGPDQNTTAEMTTTGGISGRMGSRQGYAYTTGWAGDVTSPGPDLIYVPTTDPYLSNIDGGNSVSAGGWFSLHNITGNPGNNFGGSLMQIGPLTIGVDVPTNALGGAIFYAITGDSAGGFASVISDSGTFPFDAPLALVVVTFDHNSGRLRLYKDGSLLATTIVTDRIGPFGPPSSEFNAWIGGGVYMDTFDGDVTTPMEFDSVFFIKNVVMTPTDVTYLYNSGSGRSLSEMKSHLGL